MVRLAKYFERTGNQKATDLLLKLAADYGFMRAPDVAGNANELLDEFKTRWPHDLKDEAVDLLSKNPLTGRYEIPRNSRNLINFNTGADDATSYSAFLNFMKFNKNEFPNETSEVQICSMLHEMGHAIVLRNQPDHLVTINNTLLGFFNDIIRSSDPLEHILTTQYRPTTIYHMIISVIDNEIKAWVEAAHIDINLIIRNFDYIVQHYINSYLASVEEIANAIDAILGDPSYHLDNRSRMKFRTVLEEIEEAISYCTRSIFPQIIDLLRDGVSKRGLKPEHNADIKSWEDVRDYQNRRPLNYNRSSQLFE